MGPSRTVAPAALLLDDGELEPLLEALETLDVPFVHLRGREIRRRLPRPRALLLTSARRALQTDALPEMVRGPDAPLWIVFHNQDFLPFRGRLARLGVDFLVQSSVGPDAIRLLLEYALYRGADQRAGSRLPAGTPVVCEIDGAQRGATLVELSRTGGRLRLADAPREGPLNLRLPTDLGSGELLVLPALVVRVLADDSDQKGETEIAVSFAPLDADTRSRLERILVGRSIGTRVTPLDEEGVLSIRDPEDRAERRPWAGRERRRDRQRGPARGDRREAPRAVYPHAVTARFGFATDVLLGRDLSLEGIRVEPHPGLTVGEGVRIALYGAPPGNALIVSSRVVRDDQEGGLMLRFEDLGTEERRWLACMIDALPAVESLSSERRVPGPVVLSRIVGDPQS